MQFNEIYSNIQFELKAPKSQVNSFAKYNYRSCEDILEAVKPLLHKYNVTLTLHDDIVMIGDRYYVKAVATLRNGIDSISAQALAREQDEKKGLDSSQVTGTASSYARKYALNGLFCIDDTKDADTDEYANQTSKAKPAPQPAPQKEIFNSAHPDWQKVLNNLAVGKGSIAALQGYYSISASVEKEITDFLNNK